MVTSQPGHGVVRQLEMGLKDADVVSLKRLLVVQINSAADFGQDNPSPEATHTETEGRKKKHTQQNILNHTIGTHTTRAGLVRINTLAPLVYSTYDCVKANKQEHLKQIVK